MVKWAGVALLAALGASGLAAQRTILAVGAHAADMELAAGALLAHQKKLGDRVVLLHLSLGEGGNPKMSPADYGAQKRREALAAARALGAEVIFGPYTDGLVPDSEEARRYVAGVIRQVRPTHVIAHWKKSLHKDHRAASAVTDDAVLLAALEAVKTGEAPWRGVRSIYYADNWEDAEGFRPFLYVDVADAVETWKRAVREYQMVRGGVVQFRYFDYYTARMTELGAIAGRRQAIALDVDEEARRKVVDTLK